MSGTAVGLQQFEHDQGDDGTRYSRHRAAAEPVKTSTESVEEDIDPRIKAEIANYIGRMAGEMSIMAKRGRMGMLAYFLDMARIEARNIERGAG